MSKDWQSAPLGELLIKSSEAATIKPDVKYKEVSVRLWGKGVTQRREVFGAEIASSTRFVVRSQQFIISRIDARNGAFGLVPESLDGALVSNDFPAFNLNAERLSPKFLEWMSRTRDFIDICKAASEGTTNRVRLKEDRFLTAKIPLPPLDEQRRIVARIEELSAKIEEARNAQRGSQAMIRALLLSAFDEITKNAPQKPMAEVAPLVRRPVRVELSETYPELGIRSFGKGTFHKPSLSGAEVGSKKIFRIEPDDLVFNIVFAWEGAVAVAKPQDAGRVGSHRFLTCVPREGVATSTFLCFHFLTAKGLEQLGDASPGGVDRNRTLGVDALSKIQVPVPSFNKQLWFESLHKKLDAVKEYQSQVTSELDATLPSILDKAFKGEL